MIYDEEDSWSLGKEFEIKLKKCIHQQFVKMMVFGLFSPFGKYVTYRLAAFEYIEEFVVIKSDILDMKAL